MSGLTADDAAHLKSMVVDLQSAASEQRGTAGIFCDILAWIDDHTDFTHGRPR